MLVRTTLLHQSIDRSINYVHVISAVEYASCLTFICL